jgi:hypothetical protein
MNTHCTLTTALGALALLASSHARADLLPPENPVACMEPGPTSLTFGATTTGCTISSNVDIDSFVFAGTVGDVVRITLSGDSSGLDPSFEMRGPAPSPATER